MIKSDQLYMMAEKISFTKRRATPKIPSRRRLQDESFRFLNRKLGRSII